MVRALVLICLLTATLASQDTRSLADALVHSLRAHQNADGTYGGGYLDTCRVLDLLGRSPRRYNDLDGPFFRHAAQRVAEADVGDDVEAEAWRVLALAACVTAPLATARDAARERVLAFAAAATSEIAQLALASTPGQGPPLVPPPEDASAALRCLLAAAPAAVAPPALDDVAGWTRWARASRLRGIDPEHWPPLASPPPEASLQELVAALDLVLAVHGLLPPPTPEEAPPPPPVVEHPRDPEQAVALALAWLDSRQEEGTFGLGVPGWSGPEPGITALCLSAALWAAEQNNQARPAWVDRGLDYLVSLQKPSGGIYDYGVAVYTTSAAIEALLDGGRPEDRPVVERALGFLVEEQADEGEGYRPQEDPHYGGIGYGGDERPDLSNTQMALEAAQRAGLPREHRLWRHALVYLERCQNLGEVVSHEWPRPGGGTLVSGLDGGATYMPGNSMAGEQALGNGRWSARSYGSMTYALTKSFLLCGLPPDDRRVEAAVGWILEHYTLAWNPGFEPPEKGADGLYYYYLALARTLDRLPPERLLAADGSRLAWRTDLASHLLARQRVDGSWLNEASSRWLEGSPILCTAYALLALRDADS